MSFISVGKILINFGIHLLGHVIGVVQLIHNYIKRRIVIIEKRIHMYENLQKTQKHLIVFQDLTCGQF